MRRTAVALFLLLNAGPVLAAERGPVCQEASVVDEITREVRAVNYYGDVDERSVIEQPTADPRVVRCEVCVHFALYDMTKPGPVAACALHLFEVQILTDGFVVQAMQ